MKPFKSIIKEDKVLMMFDKFFYFLAVLPEHKCTRKCDIMFTIYIH